ncbi:hypothetical protein [Undibacterium sp. RuTC16W]|uniref:hypothetical protein n=1 Tax=Undibacterium sp. RuTC16W TaxID=3413048 RepID=UPI003BF250EE
MMRRMIAALYLLRFLRFSLFAVCMTAGTCSAVDLYVSNLFAQDPAQAAVATSVPVEQATFESINERIAKELKRRCPIAIELKIVPAARHIELFPRSKEAFSISRRDNFSDEDGVILAEVIQIPVVVVAARGARLKTYDDIITLGAINGVGAMRRINYPPLSQDSRIRKVEINSVENGLRMLEAGRISALAGTQPAILAAAKRRGSLDNLGPMVVIAYGTYVLRVRPDFEKSVAAIQLRDTMLEMKKNGTIDRIYAEFQEELRRPL